MATPTQQQEQIATQYTYIHMLTHYPRTDCEISWGCTKDTVVTCGLDKRQDEAEALTASHAREIQRDSVRGGG